MFKLLNKEFAFTVDVSTVECGLKSSLKFVRFNQLLVSEFFLPYGYYKIDGHGC